MIQEGNVDKKIFFLWRLLTVFDLRNSSSRPLFLSDVLTFLFQKSTCNHTLLHVQCVWQIFLLQEYCYFREVFTAMDSSFYLGYCFLETITSIFWKTLTLLQNSNCSHTFFQIYRVFSESTFRQRGIIVFNLITKYDFSLVAGMYLFED